MIDTTLIILLTCAVAMMKFGLGLDTDIKTLIFVQHDKWLVFRAVFAGVIIVPVLFLVLILLFHPHPSITTALIIMAVCPAADLSVRQVDVLGGDVSLASSVQFISAMLSIITTPVLLHIFEKILGIDINVSLVDLIRTIAIAQFIPMGLGAIFQKRVPQHAKIAKKIMAISSLALLIIFSCIVIRERAFFTYFPLRAYAVVALATLLACMTGVIFAGKNIKEKISLAIETGLRNPGLAYLIASTNFSETRATVAIVPYIVTTSLMIILCTLLLKRSHRLQM